MRILEYCLLLSVSQRKLISGKQVTKNYIKKMYSILFSSVAGQKYFQEKKDCVKEYYGQSLVRKTSSFLRTSLRKNNIIHKKRQMDKLWGLGGSRRGGGKKDLSAYPGILQSAVNVCFCFSPLFGTEISETFAILINE